MARTARASQILMIAVCFHETTLVALYYYYTIQCIFSDVWNVLLELKCLLVPIDQCFRELALSVFPCEAPHRLNVHGILLVNPLNITVVLQKFVLEHDHIIVQALILASSNQDMVHEFGDAVKPVIGPRGELDEVVLRFRDLE